MTAEVMSPMVRRPPAGMNRNKEGKKSGGEGKDGDGNRNQKRPDADTGSGRADAVAGLREGPAFTMSGGRDQAASSPEVSTLWRVRTSQARTTRSATPEKTSTDQ